MQRGGNGRQSMIEFETIPYHYQQLLIEKYGDPRTKAVTGTFSERIVIDAKAAEYFSNYVTALGNLLPEQAIREYTNNASILNAIHDIYTAQKAARAAHGTKVKNFWADAHTAVEAVRNDPNSKVYGHSLPKTPRTLAMKYKEYHSEGYEVLINKRFGNQVARKVNIDIEQLLMSLYSRPNKPFSSDVHDDYMAFLNGAIQLVNKRTGELYDPLQFEHLSRKTVFNYLNMPDNRAVVDKKRNGAHSYNNMHRPHHHRNAPNFSFSKISMDDRDLPRKLNTGDRVKAYYAYDVASGAVIGKSYSRSKDERLFMDCLRDMFRLIDRENFGWPLEVEVENHLVNKFFDDLGFMFPFVRICLPGNSQEKRAEHLNKAKKYGVEHRNHQAIGRWWAKSEAYLADRDKINDEFVEKSFSYEQLVADDLADIREYNNQPHPNQKKYPGRTRWQVLVENMNPDAATPNKPIVMKSIGEFTRTSLRRNQYCKVQYAEYQIPGVEILSKLQPNNYDLDAYYLTAEDGTIGEVYLYQHGVYICKAAKIARYNEAKAEQTESDRDAYRQQAKYVAQFDEYTKKRAAELDKPVIVTKEDKQIMETAAAKVIETGPVFDDLDKDDIDSLLNDYNPAEYAEMAKKRI